MRKTFFQGEQNVFKRGLLPPTYGPG